MSVTGGGYSVDGAGDVNGDGRDDFIVGSFNEETAYVVFGRTGQTSVNVSSFNGTQLNGFRILGESPDGRLGRSVAGVGDVNGDGLDDVVVGAQFAHASSLGQETGTGAAYVIFGRASTSDVQVANLGGAQSPGFAINGVAPGDHAGISVNGSADMNGDGRPEVLVSTTGGTYVVFGKSSGTPVSLATFDGSQTTGFRINGTRATETKSVAGVGDLNGDGRGDVVAADAAGGASVVFGKATAATVDTSSLGAAGFRMTGPDAWTVAGARDVNGDGRPDLMVGSIFTSPRGRPDAGTVWIVFGKASSQSVDLNSFDGTQSTGFEIDGANLHRAGNNGDRLGLGLAGIGDFNGDGLDDVTVGAVGADNNGLADSGSEYVVYGRSSAATVDLATYNGSQSGGFRMDGTTAGSAFGWTAGAAHDINGDGRVDVIAGTANGLQDSILYGFGTPRAEVDARLRPSPVNVPFGDQLAGTSSTSRSVTITNVSPGSLRVQQVSLGGDNAAEFAIASDACTNTPLVSGASCTIGVKFAPARTGSKNGELRVRAEGSTISQIVPLTGNATTTLAFSPTKLTFPSTSLGGGSTVKQLTVTNGGTAPATFSQVAVSSGANVGDFSVKSQTCTVQPVPVNGFCRVDVQFAPAGVGSRSATLTLTDTAAGSPQSVALSGTGDPLKFTPSPVNFDPQRTGTTSANKTITVTNTSGQPFTVSAASILGDNASDFQIASNGCGALAAGASCTVSVRFAPQAQGPRTATLALASNSPTSPHVVALSGAGTSPTVGLTPVSLDFQGQVVDSTSPTQRITLKNTGDASLTVSGMPILGSGAGDFQVAAQTCTSAAIAPAGTCTIDVDFTPSTTGQKKASLQIADSAAGSPHVVGLSGTGTIPIPAFNPGSQRFDPQRVATISGEKKLSVVNFGDGALTVSKAEITGAGASSFAISSDTCTGKTTAPGASCSVGLRFSPDATGERAAELKLTYNGPQGEQTASLSGAGTAPALSVTPATKGFGDQTIGTESGRATFLIDNAGTADLALGGIELAGNDAAEFSIKRNTCNGPLAPGGHCEADVSFQPAGPGARQAELRIPSDAAGGPASIALTGTGVVPAAPPPVGAAAVTINNTDPYTGVQKVTLQVTAPASAVRYTISNDGGLLAGVPFEVSGDNRHSWPLDLVQKGDAAERDVYVRFLDASGTEIAKAQDNITFDKRPPATVSVSASSGSQKPVAAAATKSTLRVRASDQNSGIGGVQVTANKRHPGPKLRLAGVPDPRTHLSGTFTGTVSVRLKQRKAWVRALDGAGNPSSWRSVTLRRGKQKR